MHAALQCEIEILILQTSSKSSVSVVLSFFLNGDKNVVVPTFNLGEKMIEEHLIMMCLSKRRHLSPSSFFIYLQLKKKKNTSTWPLKFAHYVAKSYKLFDFQNYTEHRNSFGFDYRRETNSIFFLI